jgi:DNA-binding transcriptional regulator YiaG
VGGPYHFTECGLDNVYLVNGFTHEESAQGKIVRTDDLDGLLRAIAEHLVFGKRTLKGRETRFLRHHLNLSQRALAMLLAVDEQTVAGWEMGTTKLNGAAERMIRLMCAEQLRGSGSVRAFLQDTAALDDPADAAEVNMEESGEGWHAVQKAA